MPGKRFEVFAIVLAFLTSWPWDVPCLQKRRSRSPVSGSGRAFFDPGESGALRKTVQGLLDDRPVSGFRERLGLWCLLMPHQIFPGALLPRAYHQIDRSTRTVILLGPSHRVPLEGASIPTPGSLFDALGRGAAGHAAARLQALSFVGSVFLAHQQEHSLEVQFSFLQVMLEDFNIVPILTNGADHRGPGLGHCAPCWRKTPGCGKL